MKLLILLPLALFACSDYPASEGNDSEANPIEIHINIDTQNNLTDPPDNDTMEVDVDSNSDSQSDSQSDSDSSSEATIDNSTGLIYYEFQMIN
jgi:hypothetical protein